MSFQNTLPSPFAAPKSIATSAEIRDQGSTFIAHIFTAASVEEAKSHAKHVKHVLHVDRKATHEIAAWRCMVVKPGCTGLGGPDEFQLVSGSMDDGEKWAGDRTLKVMQNLAVIDAVVVVSRWYGGILLGPSRFDHIETCAMEVCRAFKCSEELRESITTLETLDVILEGLRKELGMLQQQATSKPSITTGSSLEPQSALLISREGCNTGQDSRPQAEKKKLDYSSLDLARARRLIQSRENALSWVRDSLDDLRKTKK